MDIASVVPLLARSLCRFGTLAIRGETLRDVPLAELGSFSRGAIVLTSSQVVECITSVMAQGGAVFEHGESLSLKRTVAKLVVARAVQGRLGSANYTIMTV